MNHFLKFIGLVFLIAFLNAVGLHFISLMISAYALWRITE